MFDGLLVRVRPVAVPYEVDVDWGGGEDRAHVVTEVDKV